MIINSKRLNGLPVRTQGGTPVGKVSSLDLDSETGRLTALRIKARGLVPGLLDTELSVSWGQIVEITAEEVVVHDGSVPIGAQAIAMRETGGTGVHMAKRGVATKDA